VPNVPNAATNELEEGYAMTTPNRGAFPITPGKFYELVDDRVFQAVYDDDPGGVAFVSRDRNTTYVLRAGRSGDHEVTALWQRILVSCADCGGFHPGGIPTDFTIWDLQELTS
jgi:hypothetical protein